MAVGSRESRRALALEVRTMVWLDKKFDAQRFLRTGHVAEYKAYPLPDTPAMADALKKAHEEKARLFRGNHAK